MLREAREEAMIRGLFESAGMEDRSRGYVGSLRKRDNWPFLLLCNAVEGVLSPVLLNSSLTNSKGTQRVLSSVAAGLRSVSALRPAAGGTLATNSNYFLLNRSGAGRRQSMDMHDWKTRDLSQPSSSDSGEEWPSSASDQDQRGRGAVLAEWQQSALKQR